MRDVLTIKIHVDVRRWLCNLSLFLYFCVSFAHQREGTGETLLRYGSLFLVIISFLFAYPPTRNEKGNLALKMNRFKIWLIVFLVYAALSSLWAIDASNSYDVLFNLMKVGAVCFFIMPQLKTREEIEHILWIMFWALVYMAALLLLRTPVSQWGTERIGLVIGKHSNEIGRLVALGASLGFYFYTSQKKHRIMLIALICMFGGVSLLTGSKNAIFIMVFQLALYWILISKNWKRIFQVFIVAGLTLVVLYLVMTNEFLYDLVGVRLERMFYAITGNSKADGSTWERLYFMKTAWSVFGEYPVVGIGLNNFSTYLSSIGYRNAVYSHCGFLELLSTTGMIGFCVFYYMHVFLLNRLFKPAIHQGKTAALLFTLCARIFIFDIATIGLYEYNIFTILLICYCFVKSELHQGYVEKPNFEKR